MSEIQVQSVRDLIAMLQDKAELMSDGLDTPVQIGWCTGKGLERTTWADVDTWAIQSIKGTDEEFIMVRAHPHREPGGATEKLRSPVADLEAQLEKWSKDQDS